MHRRPAGYAFAVVDGRATWTFSGNLSRGVASVCTLRLQTRVLNVPSNAGGVNISNTFTVDYRTSSGTAAPTVTSPNAILGSSSRACVSKTVRPRRPRRVKQRSA